MQPIYTITKTSECPVCNGSGFSSDEIFPLHLSDLDCKKCRSSGKITEQVSLKEVLIELGFINPFPERKI